MLRQLIRHRSVAVQKRGLHATANLAAPADYDAPVELPLLNQNISIGRGELERAGKLPGRHSHTGNIVTVFGATGFYGRYVVNALGKTGNTIVVATRDDDMSWRHLKPLADYGKLIPAYINVDDEDSLRDAVKNSNTVINLVGKHYETKHFLPWIINSPFEKVHVEAAEKIARVSREANVEHLVHVSCLAANENSRSEFARTKAKGEKVVREQFPGAVIVRPSVTYGQEDRFLNWYAQVAKLAGRVPIVEHGASKVSPVWVGDVADAIAKCAINYSTVNKTFELVGEHEYTRKEILEYVMTTIRVKPQVIDVPEAVGEKLAFGLEQLPNPLLTRDMLKLILEDEVAQPGTAGWKELEMTPAAFEKKAFNYLFQYQQGGHYAEPVDHSL